MTTTVGKPIPALGDPSNDAEGTVIASAPYTARVTIEGTSALLWRRWSCDDVAAKAAATKGSAAKKTDNIETFVWRNDKGNICLPGEYLRCAVNVAAKYRQDPRSPRKSAMDLFRAGIVCMTELADLKVKSWDYVDRRRVTVQRNGVTRERPGMNKGWRATVDLMILTPEYITASLLREVIVDAGRLVGVGDFRPTFGRFSISQYEIL